MELPNVYAQDVKKMPIDMTLSVNPLGCAPAVAKALKNLTVDDVSQYPNVDSLVQAIAEKFSIPKASIVIGNGSEQLIKLISQTFLKKDDVVLVPKGSFFLFTKESRLAGARVKLVELNALNSRFRKKPRLVFIANPATPGGETIDVHALDSIIVMASPATVVLDEANGEFSRESCVQTSVRSKNLIVLRTFSKALGLAGLRVAFATGPERLMERLKTAQQPFPVSSLTARLAQVAITDTELIEKTLSFVARERTFLTQKLQMLGLQVSNSTTNNLFIETPNASRVIDELNIRGVSVINGTFFPGMQKSGFRISIKDRKMNRLFLAKLTEALACVNKKTLIRSKEVL